MLCCAFTLQFTISNNKKNLGTVTLSYLDVMKVDSLRALVNWEGKSDRDYELQLGEECGRSIDPFNQVLLFIMKREEYVIPKDYKLLFETLCLANYMGEVDYHKSVASMLCIDKSELSVSLYYPRDVKIDFAIGYRLSIIGKRRLWEPALSVETG